MILLDDIDELFRAHAFGSQDRPQSAVKSLYECVASRLRYPAGTKHLGLICREVLAFLETDAGIGQVTRKLKIQDAFKISF